MTSYGMTVESYTYFILLFRFWQGEDTGGVQALLKKKWRLLPKTVKIHSCNFQRSHL